MVPESASPADEPGSPDRFTAATKVLDEAIIAHAFPGCAFGVLSGGKVVLHGARGHFTYEESSPAVTPETVFDLASVTKVISTTAMAMLLHQRGQLDLDAPLCRILPGFVANRTPDDSAHLVTLRHLLAHSSGLPGYVEFFRTAASPIELFQACMQLRVEAQPGTRAEYSDPGFILLGKALEICACAPLWEWTLREVFQPLAMTSTGFTPEPGTQPQIPPTEEDTTFRHRRIQGEVQDENAWVLKGVAGHAGLFSNVPDLLRFSAEILDSTREIIPTGGKANLFGARTVELFAQRQGPEGEVPGRSDGTRLHRIRRQDVIFRRNPLGI